MSLALTMYLRDAGYTDRMPRALVLLSPWVDLTMSCGSWDENAPFDVVPMPSKGGESATSAGNRYGSKTLIKDLALIGDNEWNLGIQII